MKLFLYSVSLFLAAILFGLFIYFADLSIKGANVKTEMIKSGIGTVICLLIVLFMKRWNLTGK